MKHKNIYSYKNRQKGKFDAQWNGWNLLSLYSLPLPVSRSLSTYIWRFMYWLYLYLLHYIYKCLSKKKKNWCFLYFLNEGKSPWLWPSLRHSDTSTMFDCLLQSISVWYIHVNLKQKTQYSPPHLVHTCMFCWRLIGWLFTVLRPAQDFITHMETPPLPVKGYTFRPMLGAQGLWAGRDLYRTTPSVKWDLGFSGLIQRTTPFCRFLRHTRGCEGFIVIRILTGSVENW
jgi:hypothetical protein